MKKDIYKFEINTNDVFKLLNHSNRTKDIAEKALKNEIIPFPGFDTTQFNQEIWSVTKKEKYGNSYILYLHALRVCAELLLHYENTNEIEYFYKAEEIINSWIEYSKTESPHRIVWYDHTTANRTQVLIHYLHIALSINRDIDFKLYYELLVRHGKVMMDDKKYNNNNHGLMMDRSLMILGNVLEIEEFKVKGKARAVTTFWYSFSAQGIHLENSPQYHNMVVRMYTDIEKYLNKRNDTLGGTIKNFLELSKSYPSYVSNPNKRLASIGDSGSDKQRVPKIYKNVYDKEAGISILQHKDPIPFFLTFICGYSSRVHKHKDDLSITLNYNNEDFFVDPGKYSYTWNKIRQYIISKEAHSGYFMSRFDYTIKNENRFSRKVSFENYYENEKFTVVSGYNHDYDGSNAKLIRNVIQFKEQPIFILVDNLKTDKNYKLKFTQLFNLAAKVEISENDKINLTVNKTSLTVEQFNDVSEFEIINGDLDKPVAVNTTGFAQVEKTKQLKYNKITNDKNVFLTAVFDENYIKNVIVKIEGSTVKVMFNNEEYYIYI